MRKGLITLFVIFCSCGVASAQDPTITLAVAGGTPLREVAVTFSQVLTNTAGAPQLDEPRVRLLPDNIAPTSVTPNPLPGDVLTLRFATDIPATATRVCFDRVRFTAGGTARESAAQVCANLSRDIKAAQAEALAVLNKVPKTSRDKNIFASGFVTTASDQSSGGADLVFNRKFDSPNLGAFLQVKKATAEEGDSKNFETGARFRRAWPWRPGELEAIRKAPDTTTLNQLIADRQTNIVSGVLFDITAKLEGDASDFEVTNFVGESALQFRTLTKGFLGRSGFWRGFILPVGVEIGHTMGTPVPAETTPTPGTPATEDKKVDRIARYKVGAGFTLYYDNSRPQAPVQRVELDVSGVARHLFLSESRFNEETKKIDTTNDGLHGYAQVDLKVFFVRTDAGSYGFKLSFNRGRLPPVYANVNSFNFGFVMESGEQDE